MSKGLVPSRGETMKVTITTDDGEVLNILQRTDSSIVEEVRNQPGVKGRVELVGEVDAAMIQAIKALCLRWAQNRLNNRPLVPTERKMERYGSEGDPSVLPKFNGIKGAEKLRIGADHRKGKKPTKEQVKEAEVKAGWDPSP